MAEVRLTGVSKVYGDGTRAIDDLTLEVRDGEFVVLVGPSGCGKTTALRMIAGLEEVSAGTIGIGGSVVNGTPPRDRDVAMVFQSYALYPHLNVYDNIAFGLQLRKVPKSEIDRRVHEVAEVLELTGQLGRKPRKLSGGQRQRVAMGRAIVREPRAFLMDEPLCNLDARLRVQMRAQIARIQRDLGVTTVYVTHDQTEAMTLGDRVAVLRGGRLQQVAPPQELYDRPHNLFVAGFIGAPGMNLVRAGLEATEDGLTVVLAGQSLRLSDAVRQQRPALADFAGRTVVLGIRPEDMEDAEIVGAREGETVSSVADLVEAMGSDLLVHFPIDVDPVPDEASPEHVGPVGSGAVLVGRFSPRSRVFEGEPVTVRVDTERLHFFDPGTGLSIWDDREGS